MGILIFPWYSPSPSFISSLDVAEEITSDMAPPMAGRAQRSQESHEQRAQGQQRDLPAEGEATQAWKKRATKLEENGAQFVS